MMNHVYYCYLLTPQLERSIPKAIQMIGCYYVECSNHNYHHRTGTLWEGRYKTSLIDSELYLLTCCRYIELNPVRVNMVTHPSEYPWSSYRCNASGIENLLITHHSEYTALANTDKKRQLAYRDLFKLYIAD